jgi:hypothetical protein
MTGFWADIAIACAGGLSGGRTSRTRKRFVRRIRAAGGDENCQADKKENRHGDDTQSIEKLRHLCTDLEFDCPLAATTGAFNSQAAERK